MRLLLLSALVLVAGCSRGLTPGEAAFAARLFGPETAASRIRLTEAGPVGAFSATYPTRPATTCRERILPPPEGDTFETRTAAVALWDHVLTSPDWYLDDYLPGWPGQMNLVAAMFFAHEITHVWQWRNREQTGYSLARVATEHRAVEDPYLFDPHDGRRFADYGYEQQASLVEEYVCCAAVAPGGARTARLRDLLAEALPLQSLPVPDRVLIPYPEADLSGICG